MNLAKFLHDLCQYVLKRCDLVVELEDVGVYFDGGFVYGCVQWRGGWLRSILEWRDRVSELWLTDSYGPVYFETNAHIVNHDMLKAWHTLVLAPRSFAFPLLHYHRLMGSFTATCSSLLDGDTAFAPVRFLPLHTRTPRTIC